MGWFGLFGQKGPSQKAIDKQVTHVKEQYAKPEYRQMAMDQLLEWGTKESLKGLLSRFTVVVQSPHWDEEEKRWLVGEFAKRGDLAKEVLTEFLMTANEVTYVILALSRLCSEEELVSILQAALRARLPEDHRSSQSKMELIAALEERQLPQLSEELLPYLDDHNDDVKCITLDVLAAKKADQAYASIARMITESHHSARVLRHAASMVHKLEIPVDLKAPLAEEVTEDFVVRNGKLKPVR